MNNDNNAPRAIINKETIETSVISTIWHVYTLNNNHNLLDGFTYRDYFYNYENAVKYCDDNGYTVFLTLE